MRTAAWAPKRLTCMGCRQAALARNEAGDGDRMIPIPVGAMITAGVQPSRDVRASGRASHRTS